MKFIRGNNLLPTDIANLLCYFVTVRDIFLLIFKSFLEAMEKFVGLVLWGGENVVQNHLSGEKSTKNSPLFFYIFSPRPLYLNQSGITTLQCKSIPSTRRSQFAYRDENPRKSHKRTMEPPRRKVVSLSLREEQRHIPERSRVKKPRKQPSSRRKNVVPPVGGVGCVGVRGVVWR